MTDVAPDWADVSSSDRFGEYELRGLLGRGGMGDVHRAYDTRRCREVALKLLPPHLAADRTLVERFRREARALVQLTDPNIVPVHDVGEIDGRLFIDMTLVEGRDLAGLIAAGGPMDAAHAVHVVEQAARALDTAHRQGLVHRDVKPSNLLVLTDRGSFTYLVDFGIAYAVGTVATSLTSSGSTIGTLAYMSPERFGSETTVDGRADIYALACVLFEALTGHPPFPYESVPALVNAHLNAPPPRVTERRPDLEPVWDEVIARGMAKAPDDRHSTAGELAAEARAALPDDRTPWAPGLPTLPGRSTPPARTAVPGQWTGPPPLARAARPVVGHVDSSSTRYTAERPNGARRPLTALLVAVAVLAIAMIAVPFVIQDRDGPAVASPASDAASPVLPELPTAPTVAVDTFRTFRSDARGWSVDVPTVLSEVAAAPSSDGSRLTEPGGSTVLLFYGDVRFDGDDPSDLLADALERATVGGGITTYSDEDRDSYTGSGLDRNGNIFHVHGQLSGDSVAIVSWTYPQNERTRWDAAVTRTTKTLRFD